MSDDLTLEQEISDAISLVLRAHGWFYDSHGWASQDNGGASAYNGKGISVAFTIDRDPFRPLPPRRRARVRRMHER